MDKLFITVRWRRFECDPLGYGDSAITASRDREQVFYRERFEGELTFRGDDFTRISEVELSNDQCAEILFEIERDGREYWNGYFTCSMCRFDFDRRVCSVTPQPRDRFEPFMKSLETAINITTLPDVTVFCGGGWNVLKGKDFMGAVRALVGLINPDLLVSSTFFEDATNPATGQANKLINLCIAQKSDAKRYNASEPATKGDLTFELFTSMMRSMFNVYWNITDYGVFELEHISYFDDLGVVVNLRGRKGEYGRNTYTYDSVAMPSMEAVEIEGYTAGFAEGRVEYDKNCALGEPVEVKFDICTDVKMLKGEGDDMPEVQDSGFFLFACDDSLPRQCVSSETGIGTIELNGALAMSTLVKDYWGWNRSLKKGRVNGQIVNFFSAKRRIIQSLPIVECIELDTGNSYETGLTDILNMRAKIREKKKYVNGNVDLVLEYGDLQRAYIVIQTRFVFGTSERKIMYSMGAKPPEGGVEVKFKLKFHLVDLNGVEPDIVVCDSDWQHKVLTEQSGRLWFNDVFAPYRLSGEGEIALIDLTGTYTHKIYGAGWIAVDDITC